MGVHLVRRTETVAVQGAAGWLMEAWRGLRARAVTAQGRPRQLRLIETLPVGGRRQLMLVSCGGERFLVGTGADGVGTIVRVRPDAATVGLAGER